MTRSRARRQGENPGTVVATPLTGRSEQFRAHAAECNQIATILILSENSTKRWRAKGWWLPSRRNGNSRKRGVEKDRAGGRIATPRRFDRFRFRARSLGVRILVGNDACGDEKRLAIHGS